MQLVTYFILFYLIVVSALYITLRTMFGSFFIENGRMSHDCLPMLQMNHINQQKSLNWVFGTFGLTGLILTFIGGVMISHRAAGPIYRLRRLVREITDGQVPDQFKSRKDDYFQELFHELNQLLNGTGTRSSKRKGDHGPKS